MKRIILLCVVLGVTLWSQEIVILEDKIEIDFWLLAAVIAFLIAGGLAYKYIRLDQLVRQRTEELETFNHKLQDEISKAVEKNRTQENILMQQAKMAEIGSMVESIAHQWRQPLNILGLAMTRLNINISLGNNNDMGNVIDIV